MEKNVSVKLKRQEAEIKKLQSENHLAHLLISLMAHDFRGTARNLQWVIEHLEEGAINSETLHTLLPELKSGIRQITQSTEDTLQWIKSQQDDFQPVLEQVRVSDVMAKAQEAVLPMASKKGISFRFEADPDLGVRSDRILLTFVLKRIIENAVKYSYPDGEVAIKGIIRPDGQVSIRITDFGMGMGRKALSGLFTLDNSPYTGTAGEKGAGLSLVVSKQLADQLGITIHYDSAENKGTTVELIFSRGK